MNRFKPEQSGSRREFFRASARYGLAATLLALVTAGARKRSPAGETCTNRGICSGCGVFANCGLPAALSAKAFHAKKGGAA